MPSANTTLAQRGAEALRAAEAALAASPYSADAHDAFARALVEADELARAADAWEAARTLAPHHVGALKGLGYLAFRRGDLLAAERLLSEAVQRAPNDRGAWAALHRVRGRPEAREPNAPPPPTATAVPVTSRVSMSADTNDDVALLANRDGLVLAGSLGGPSGAERRAAVACDMGTLARAIHHATTHLGLGAWSTALVELDRRALVVSAPMPDALVLTEAHGEGAAGRALAKVAADGAHVRLLMGGAL